jgi:hypothetical protein
MVEKGDQGLDVTPTSSSDEDLRRPLEAPPGTPMTWAIEEDDVESDDDLSESGVEERSQGTADTVVVDDLPMIGQAHYDDTRCLVILSMKVGGHELYCGYPRGSCPRRKHKELQLAPERRSPPVSINSYLIPRE